MKTDEIVKALRCVSTVGHEAGCESCPYWISESIPEDMQETFGSDVLYSCDIDRVGLDGADLIERLTDRCARYAEEIAVLQERIRRIPVTERLPDVGVGILAYYRDQHINMGSWGSDDWLEEDVEDGYITHWMPLPEGPEVTGWSD